MPSKFNIDQVELLTEKFTKAKAIYFTDFLGLDVSSITTLRNEFFKASVEYTVAKNTLIKLAAKNKMKSSSAPIRKQGPIVPPTKTKMTTTTTTTTITTTSKPWSPEKILYLGGENKPIFRYFLAT